MIDPQKNDQPSEQPQPKAPAEINPNHPSEIELPPVDDPKTHPPEENEDNQNTVGPQSPSTSPTEQPKQPQSSPKIDTVGRAILGDIIKPEQPIVSNPFAQEWVE